MEGKHHLMITSTIFLLLNIFVSKIQITDIIFPIFLTLFPDIDLKFEKSLGHRSVFTHSILLPLLVFLFNPEGWVVLVMFSISLHLICDISILSKKGGFYTIVIWNIYLSNKVRIPKYRLKSVQTTIWLVGNFLISLGIFTWWCLI